MKNRNNVKHRRYAVLGALALITGLAGNASAEAWKFGVISDTQWTVADDGKNPNTVAANIIKQVDGQFIAANVKLVVAVGDMADDSNDATTHNNNYVRALYAQDLYNAGIGFYPTRGNHEAANGNYTGSSADFRHAYPQIVPGLNAGSNNSTPSDITTALISPAGDLANNPPATVTGTPFVVGNGFSAPTAANLANDSVSYAFNYNNVTFMLLDQFQSPDYYTTHIPEQMDWINGTLSGRPANTHAFVFTHKNMLGGNHKDNMFGAQVNSSDPGDCNGLTYSALSPASQTAFTAKTSFINTFLASMQANEVKYVISGHDHHHYNSIVTSPDLQSKAHQLICASDSSKFYTPGSPGSANDQPLEQQLSRVGYYIFTVDGPRVTIDYYADVTASNYKGPFNFVKQSSTGYSLNGQEFVIPEGAAYTSVTDNTTNAAANGETGYVGTTMRILNGINTSTAANNYGKAQAKAVNTGWAPTQTGLASDVLSVWGLQQIGATQSDSYALSLSYNPAAVTAAQLASGAFALVSQDSNGNWINAVNLNTGGNPQFVSGPYVSSYSLGTYGVDTATGTVWAVVNHQGNFAAGPVVRRTNLASLRIATLSDIHYLAPNLLVNNGSAFQTYLAADRKLLAESASITKAALDAVVAQQPDILLVSGDLTKDGEYDSHIGVSNLLAGVAATGVKVFVIPGNHDVNNIGAMSYNGASATPVPNVSPSQFSSIYAPFGYNQAIAKDPTSLTYVVEPVPGLWILCMDSCQYSPGQDPVAGSFPTDRLNWITSQLASAQAQGKVVIGMMHHGLMEHFRGQATLFPQYVVSDYANVSALFASYGMKVVFTGHFHAQDIVQGTFNGNTIYDVETGSSVTYPCPYRLIDLQPNGQFAINSHRITAINYNLGSAPDFQTYALNYLNSGMVPLSAYMLQAPPFSLDAATANYLAPVVAEAMVDHYIGDEPGLAGATPATQAIVTNLLQGNAQQQQLGGAIYSILTDLPPADNNLTISISTGELAGPASGASFTSNPAVLSWVPVWGASVYHVTVSSGGSAHTFDVAGTSLALPSYLPNGNYTWTVMPDNGTASAAGSFSLLIPPTLSISGPDANGNMNVSWPTGTPAGYQLQFSPDLNTWVPVTGSGFFRFIKQ